MLDEFGLETDAAIGRPYHGLIVRSDAASGAIQAIHMPRLPANTFALGARDIPGENRLELFGGHMPLLADEEVRYAGEPVLLLAGPNRDTLRSLAERIRISYKRQAPVLSLYRNLSGEPFELRRGDAESALRTADIVVEGEYRVGLQRYFHLRHLGALAHWDGRAVSVHAPTPYPHHMRAAVASALSLPQKKVRVVVSPPVPSSSGEIAELAVMAVYAALLAVRLENPVIMEYNWSESALFGPNRHPCVIRHRTAVSREGDLLAAEVIVDMDTGAYSILSPLALERACLSALGVYRCGSFHIRARLFNTNRPPAFGFAGLGEPQSAFALEVHSCKIADAVGMDPAEWKKRNLVRSDEPYPVGGKRSPSDAAESILEDVITRSDFGRKFASYEANKKSRTTVFPAETPLRGIGLSLCRHGVGMPSSYERTMASSVKIVLGTNKKLRILTSLAGRSNARLLTAVAAEMLSESAPDIAFDPADTAAVPDSGPDIGSRSVIVAAKLLADCCRALNTKRLKSVPPISVKRTYRPPASLDWAPGRWKAGVYPAYCWEAAAVEVEIDPVTLEPRCTGVWISLDAGRLPAEEVALLRVEEAAVVDLGFATSGDPDHPLPASFRYPFPRIQDIPRMEISFVQQDHPGAPLGMKGLGDQPVIGVAPAYVAAVSQAIGTLFDRIPLTPEAMQERLQQLEENRGEEDE